MSAHQCAPDCPKMKERRKLHEDKLPRKNRIKPKHTETDDDIAPSTVTSRASQADLSIDSSGLSNETEYLSVPLGDSSSKDPKEHLRRHVDNIEKIEKSHRKYQEGPYNRRAPTPRQRKPNVDNAEPVEVDEPTDRSRKKDRSCENEECTGKPPKVRKRSEMSPSYLSQESSTDPICPALCELDLVKIPESKQRCESSCPFQALEDERKEMDQAEIDKYVLYGGLRYFDDLCHCSLKCLLVQIFGDKFIQKTAFSAFFFAMGLKLCYELDSWYIPF